MTEPNKNFESVSTDYQTINEAGAIAVATTSQTVDPGTFTKVQIDTSEKEDTGVLDIDLSNNNISVQTAGLYLIVSEVNWSSDTNWSTGDNASAPIFINGARGSGSFNRKVGTNREVARSSVIKQLSQGDDIDGRAFQDSGSQQTLDGSDILTRFQVVRLA